MFAKTSLPAVAVLAAALIAASACSRCRHSRWWTSTCSIATAANGCPSTPTAAGSGCRASPAIATPSASPTPATNACWWCCRSMASTPSAARPPPRSGRLRAGTVAEHRDRWLAQIARRYRPVLFHRSARQLRRAHRTPGQRRCDRHRRVPRQHATTTPRLGAGLRRELGAQSGRRARRGQGFERASAAARESEAPGRLRLWRHRPATYRYRPWQREWRRSAAPNSSAPRARRRRSPSCVTTTPTTSPRSACCRDPTAIRATTTGCVPGWVRRRSAELVARRSASAAYDDGPAMPARRPRCRIGALR